MIKLCTVCNEPLVALTSLNKKYCTGCKKMYDWELAPGQKSLLIQGLVGSPDKDDSYETDKLL